MLFSGQDLTGFRVATRQDFAEFQAATQDVAELRKDFAELQKDVSGLQKDVAELRADVRVLKAVYGPVVIGLLVAIAGMVFRLTFFQL